MIREIDLVSYLPAFLADYKEIVATLEAENPEFRLVWQATDRVLNNEFIATADEYGIARFEKMLEILPSSQDTLESRRSRVQARWFHAIPYIWRVFLERLIALCGESNFSVTADFLNYRVTLDVALEMFGQVEELEHMIETMIPCNLVFDSENKIFCTAKGFDFLGGGLCAVETFIIPSDFPKKGQDNGRIF